MLVGYMRVSKSDGSQTTDPQRDALREAGVDEVCGAPRDRCAKAVSPGCVACEVERARSTPDYHTGYAESRVMPSRRADASLGRGSGLVESA
jgi:hypothetical protein